MKLQQGDLYSPQNVVRYALLALFFWTALVAASLDWSIRKEHQQVLQLATAEARATFHKDEAIRNWATIHGGVYIRPSERTPPNPYLSHLPNRDVITTNGTRLTLMNPAYVMRQLTEEFEHLYGIKGKITSLKLINPINKADAWEERALRMFEAGKISEFSEVSDIDGEQHLRFMGAIHMQPGCVGCHGHLGFKTGDIRGGFSIAVPLEPFQLASNENRSTLISTYLITWLAGIFIILFLAWRSNQRVRERLQVERALRHSEERYMLSTEGANDGFWDWILERNEIYFSSRWYEMMMITQIESSPSPELWFSKVHEKDVDQLKQAIDDHLKGETGLLDCEYRVILEDNSQRWMRCRGLAVRDQKRAIRIAGSQTDITEQKLVEKQLIHQALHDTLTGLPNRTLFLEQTAQAIERTSRDSTLQFAVLFLDLDRFKNVNDSLGHHVGDKLLKHAATILSESVRPGDTVARFGGDEFAILLDNIQDWDSCIWIAERILANMNTPIVLEEHKITATISIGMTQSDLGYKQPEDMLRDADTALYRAKAAGRARLQIFNPKMHANALALLRLESDLRQALKQKQFILEYQPIIQLETERTMGLEALLRWQHPEHGLITPAKFIQLAEETGLIVEIGRWALLEACRQLKYWNSQHPEQEERFVSVNVSFKQILRGHLPVQVEHALSQSGLPPHLLHLEITESQLIKKPKQTQAIMKQLKKRGVHFSIDDFGTGYSSLSYLHRFPFDTLKIDRSFVSTLDSADRRQKLVHTMITLAQDLDMQLIAEGVETQSQVERLQAMGCELVQGFYFHPPLNADKLPWNNNDKGS